MENSDNYNFNEIMKRLIKKSLFTQRQVEIIAIRKKLLHSTPTPLSRGAFYRELSQVRSKLSKFFVSLAILRSLGVIDENYFDVIERLSQQISVIQSSDVFPEKQEDVISVIDMVLERVNKI